MAPFIDRSILRAFARVGTIGLNMVLSTFVGYLIGSQLDKWIGTAPWFTIIFLLLGIIAGFRELARIAKRISRGSD